MAFRQTISSRKIGRSTRVATDVATISCQLRPLVLKLTFIPAVVAALNEAVLLPLFPFWVPILHIPSLPFQLTAPALALLLAFRTNASYGRFDEAQKAWGSNVNRSQDFSRQALTWIWLPARLERLLRYCVL
ncbi:unnamed protein product [Calypogeia fissa]